MRGLLLFTSFEQADGEKNLFGATQERKERKMQKVKTRKKCKTEKKGKSKNKKEMQNLEEGIKYC